MVARTIDGIYFRSGTWPLDPDLPTLLFVHGSGGSSRLWEQQLAAFGGAANTVALDLPGHGRSGGAGRSRVEDYAADVMAFTAAIQAPRPIPCGLSIGGAIVLQMLLDHADAVVAGGLINTGARLRVLPEIFDTIENDYAGFLDLLGVMGASPKTDTSLLVPLMEDTRTCPPEVTSGDFRACDRFDVMARLSDIQVPVLVVSSADDRLTPPKYADFLEKNTPGAIRAHIPDAGHLAPLEQPARLNAALSAFLAAIAA